MHPHILNQDDIADNLYPALLQVFAIILIGYLAGNFQVLSNKQSLGLNKFVGTFALPALLLKNLAILDFKSVDWLFMTSIFISKTIVFALAILITLLTIRPLNIGLAGVFGIFVSQSNDFALGYPIVSAIYSQTHPDYINYIYLLAPISLCILNPIAFLMLEANEKLHENKQIDELLKKRKKSDINYEEVQQVISDSEVENAQNKYLDNDRDFLISKVTNNYPEESAQDLSSSTNENADLNSALLKKKIKTREIIFSTIKSTFSNPIVLMTFFGIAANFIFNGKIPSFIEPVITTLSNSFSAIALFYLGFSMVGKIKNLTFSSIVIILILIFTKSLFFPLLTREIVLHINNFRIPDNATSEAIAFLKNETESLSTFSFLYGTFPTAPALFFYINSYTGIQQSLVSAALVFGTLASAPLMMVSGKMISINYANHTSNNFDDIQCKTAFGFSILTWFCCIWVLYVFLASGRLFLKPHRYTFFLILSQMANAIVHIFWTSFTGNSDKIGVISSYSYVFFCLFTAYLTRCWPLTIILNIIALSNNDIYNQSKFQKFFFKLAQSPLIYYFIGFFLPLIVTIISILIGNIPENQKMMLSVGKPQVAISCFLLGFLILTVSYILVFFARSKSEQSSQNDYKYKKQRYYSLSDETDNEQNINGEIDNSENNQEEIDTNINHDNELDNLVVKDLNIQYQTMQHVSLVVILTFNSILCFSFQMWSLFEEAKSGIFYELQLLDTTLLYGQGFFTFLSFGLDNEFIFAPVFFKIKELLKIIPPFKLVALDEVSASTIEICKKFEKNYKAKCIKAIEKNQRFHYNYYRNVFKASDFVDWLLKKKIVKNRKNAINIGRKLIEGRVIHHVTNKRHFHDGFHFYKFNQ